MTTTTSTGADSPPPATPENAGPAAPNADPAELAKFSALAHRWGDPQSEFRPLHQINPLRLEWIAGIASLEGKAVLDVGCGGGILAEAMARCGASVKGIDLSEKALKVARFHLLESRLAVDYELCPAETLAAREPGARLRRPRPSRRASVLLHDQPQSESLCARHHRGRVRAQAAAQGHARLCQVHPPLRVVALLPEPGPGGA